MNRHGKNKPRWQKHYQYELVRAITGKNNRQIRYAMRKLGLEADTDGFAKCLNFYFKK